MASVVISAENGIVVRLAALRAKGIQFKRVLDAMEVDKPLDKNEDIASFGPHFGREAADEFQRRLESLGLVYIDDFFIFSGDFPDWTAFQMELR
ncbi:hypothetical protein [Steroidobacter agaridevorans]|uniref:hypothetical protein n=1 Tax=Steroidobacter agaridevorans TaxID=2695856 RepID=UPI001320DA91|nr:hypothetical protein [Steroidobacter agaridevorans]GFE88653.1 hypothetical protein GCM10011488_36070 [Steroidobacter agaridevorans]